MRTSSRVAIALVLLGAACGNDDDPTPSPGGGTTPPPPSGGATVAQGVTRTDIVADRPGATALDPGLVNAWGLAFNPLGFAWVSSTEKGVSQVYDTSGRQVIPPIAIPRASCADGSSPTGQVFNGSPDAFMGDTFIFVTEQGTIAGWKEADGSTATLRAGTTSCDAVYKGVTLARGIDGRPLLVAADFRDATIDVFDSSYTKLNTSGRFLDPNLPAGYAPFNVKEIQGRLLVAYAKQDADREDDVRGAGNGFVDLFNVDGTFVARLISGGELDSPWAIALTPSTFGTIPNRLLIGNFGDGRIHVYALDPAAGLARVRHEGLLGSNGSPLVIDGLWALEFGLDAGGFRSDVLYFTAGPDDEEHGVFGRLEAQGTAPPPAPPPYMPTSR